MKKQKLLAAVAAAILLTACNTNSADNAEEQSAAVTVTETASQTAATVSETSAETTEMIPTETEASSENSTEPEYAKVSEDNVFIDYKFIEDYQGTTDIGVLAAGAVEFLTESEYYAESTENIGEFTGDEFKKYFDESGNILPRLQTAYPEDYDGDGSTETFIIVDMPYMIGIPTERSFLIYADSRGEMTLLDHISGIYDTALLNYGSFKQITFGGSGTAGVEDHTNLYGVADGKAVLLYSGRVSYSKEDCFLATYGFQGAGDFLCFDTAEQEYCVIGSTIVDIEDVRAMDTSNSLSDIFDNYKEGDFLFFSSIGGKYYCVVRGAMDPGDIYVYENGSFTYLEDSKIRVSTNLCDLKEVTNIDITEAIAEMKSVK